MSDTTFTNGVTLTDADWFNDVNRSQYTIFGDPLTGAALIHTLVPALTADATPDQDLDYVLTEDASAAAGKKVLLKNLKRMAPISSSLTTNIPLNDVAAFIDGPSVAQGSTGLWYASGTVSVQTTGTAARIDVKLYDGTTTIATATHSLPATAGVLCALSVSGYIDSPAGNIRIAAKDASSTSTCTIVFNVTGLSKDSTLTAMRIG